MTPAPGRTAFERRLSRLREELDDEGVPLPIAGAAGMRLLAELTYARRPPQHEGRLPGYGALVFSGVPDWDASAHEPLVVPGDGVPVEQLRRYADGRSSFTIVSPEGITGIATFEHSAEDELSAVRLLRTGAIVVQRTDRGFVRACAPNGVVVWTGSQWLFKPLAEEYVRLVERLAPHADRAVLSGMLELAVHSLAARRVGATLIWNLDGVPVDETRAGLVELDGASLGPPLSVARRAHFSALRSALAQVDLAAVVGADGVIGPIGVRLGNTTRAGSVVPAIGGARHSSARRFSFDVPGVVVIVVSEAGSVTVFSGGGVAAEISATSGRAAGLDQIVLATSMTTCAECHKAVLVEQLEASASGPRCACPVCGSPLHMDSNYRVVGVPVSQPERPVRPQV